MTIERVTATSKAIHEQYWLSNDLGLCAALLSLGFELVMIDRTVRSKVVFVFKQEAGINKVADGYLSDELKVKARKYFDNIKALKSRIYSDSE